MDPTPLNPAESKPTPPRSRGKSRSHIIEFEFAKETVVPPAPSTQAKREVVKPSPVNLPAKVNKTAQSPLRSLPPQPADAAPALPEKITTEPNAEALLSKLINPPTSHQRNTMSNPPIKPTTITDFKRNVDQQKKEQKSFGNVLATITYVVLIGLILVTGLAGFGGYELWMELKSQATSISSLDQKYEAEVTGLTEDAKRSKAEMEKAEAQVARQQEQITALRASLEKALADARSDKASRSHDVASLQKRVSDLENRFGR